MSYQSGVRISARPKVTRIMIANAKGGVGKTTLTTNLAQNLALFGSVGVQDYDPQDSTTYWLSLRKDRQPKITNICTKKIEYGQVTRSWMSHKIEQQFDYVLTDTPAGLASPYLDRLLKYNDILLIPVSPSKIDIHATAGFIKTLLLNPQFRSQPLKLGVVMNRVKANTLSFQKLQRFLATLDIPVVTTVRDTQRYLHAAEKGLSVTELPAVSEFDLETWAKLTSWIENNTTRSMAIKREHFLDKTKPEERLRA